MESRKTVLKNLFKAAVEMQTIKERCMEGVEGEYQTPFLPSEKPACRSRRNG